MKKISILFVFMLLLSLPLIAQEGGSTIISTEEANELYGEPANVVRIYSTVVSSLLDTHEYIMIKIDGDKVNVLGKNRAPVIQQFEVEDQDVYYVFESKTLKELLNTGSDNESYIELRIGGSAAQQKNINKITDGGGEIITVTNGKITTIPPFWCPPYCFED